MFTVVEMDLRPVSSLGSYEEIPVYALSQKSGPSNTSDVVRKAIPLGQKG